MNWDETSAKIWDEIVVKVKELLDSGYTTQAVADLMGLKTKSVVSDWKQGKRISINTPFPQLMKYLDALNIDYAKFFPESKVANGFKEIFVYDTVAGGQPIDMQESEPICKVKVPDAYASGCTFEVKIKGSSMAPYAPDGSILGISTNFDFVLGEIYLTYVAYHGRTVKRVLRDAAGRWILRSENPDKAAYPDIIVEESESENLVIGRVVWVLKHS